MDFGICTMDNRASMPSKVAAIGTPITGKIVFDAITPGKCAAIPAPAIITSVPSSSNLNKAFSSSSGTL